MVTPRDVQWKEGPPALPRGARMAVIEGDPAAPGKLFTMRLRLPAGYRIPPHTHPADEHVTVLSGTLYMSLGEKADAARARALPAGSFMVMPAGAPHSASTRSETVVQLHGVGPWGITYLNPADDPRNSGVGGAGKPPGSHRR